MDDISEHMNWELMDKCETLFDKYEIKPLLGVIPINQDPELLKYSRNDKFWEKVQSWKNKGWEITMHGCNHLYTQKSDKKDIFNYGGDSEFYGLDYDIQLNKIKAGLQKFEENKLVGFIKNDKSWHDVSEFQKNLTRKTLNINLYIE